MFTVYLKSAGGTKKYFTEFETEAEAESFCREYGWEWVDENEFVWDMDYEEGEETEFRSVRSVEATKKWLKSFSHLCTEKVPEEYKAEEVE